MSKNKNKNGPRAQAHRRHFFMPTTGRARARAAFRDERAALLAIDRIAELVGRRYMSYRCTWHGCGAWHIEPCRRRPADLARPA